MSDKMHADSYALSYLEKKAEKVGYDYSSTDERQKGIDDYMDELNQYDLTAQQKESLIYTANGHGR